MSALLATLFLGVFILIGVAAVYFTKNSESLMQFTIGAAFLVMALLISLEVFPEALLTAINRLGIGWGIGFVICFTCGGILLLSLLDRFVPEHGHNSDTEKLMHIGIITSIAIIIHNLVEGAGVYAVYASSPTLGMLMCLSVGMHNIPLGMMVASAFYGKKKNAVENALLVIGMVFSSFAGGLIVHVLGLELEGTLISSALLAASCGMLIFILFMELAPEVFEHRKNKPTLAGVAFGAIVFFLGLALA